MPPYAVEAGRTPLGRDPEKYAVELGIWLDRGA